MGLRPSHLLRHLQSRGEYECLCVTRAGLAGHRAPPETLAFATGTEGLQAQALSPAPQDQCLPRGPGAFMYISESSCSCLCATSKSTSSALLEIGSLAQNFPGSPAKLSLFPGAYNCILWHSFSPHLSEVSSAGFFKETQKFSTYLNMQQEGGYAPEFREAKRLGAKGAMPNVCSTNCYLDGD